MIHLPEVFKKGGRPVALTAYSYPFARLIDEAGADMVLVGDSLGMVEQGGPDTVGVTLAEMEYHVRMVRRGVSRALLAADLPAGTCATPAASVQNAGRLLDAGADVVKIEGGGEVTGQVLAMVDAGISVVGHIGMLPQRIREEGRYRIKGRTMEERDMLLSGARALAGAGVCAMVLELVEPSLAGEITRAVPVPTIGIGSGTETDGQILVTYDLIGLTPWFKPGFVRPVLNTGDQIREAVRDFAREIRIRSETPPN